MTHIIIARSHPLYYYGWRLLLLMLAGALLWGAFELGYQQAQEDLIQAKGGRHSLLIQHKILTRKNSILSKELLHLERQYELQKGACQLIKQDFFQEQQKINDLKQQLLFYQSIMEPDPQRTSVYLHSIAITPVAEKNMPSALIPANEQKQDKPVRFYRYQFIVAQKTKKRTITKGSVNIKIHVKNADKHSVLNLTQVLLKPDPDEIKNKAFRFAFKYFQQFSGFLALPDNIEPVSLSITIDTRKKKSIIQLDDLLWSKKEGVYYVEK